MSGILAGKKIVFFHDEFTDPGGSERVALEASKFFEQHGGKTYLVTFDFHKDALFNGQYTIDVHTIGTKKLYPQAGLKSILWLPYQILALKRKLEKIHPDIIISRTSTGCIYLYFATMFSSLPYVTFVYETPIWAYGDQRQHAFIYQKAFNHLRQSSETYRYFDHLLPPNPGLFKRVFVELGSLAEVLAVRKAKKIFAYSCIMQKEIKEVFKKDAIVLHGSISNDVLSYQPKQNIKEKLGIPDKRMILSISRLALRKRVDLLIRAMSELSTNFGDAILVIGGRGPEEEKLKKLAKTLNMEDRVRFVGFIPEEELLDYYATCDVFGHADWADADIAPIVALALGKKVVWTTDMETPPELCESGFIFVAAPAPRPFARMLEQSLSTEVNNRVNLYNYTWDNNNDVLTQQLVQYLK